MLIGSLTGAGLGFSLNPLHYVKKGVQAAGKGAKVVGTQALHAEGLQFKIQAAIGKLPGASAVLNSIVPGAGALLPLSNRMYDYAGDRLLRVGKRSAPSPYVPSPYPTAYQPAPITPGSSTAPVPAPASPDSTSAPASQSKGAKLLGMPKKYVIIGGAVVGGVLLLSLLRSKKG